jgi:microcystin-dependent protein
MSVQPLLFDTIRFTTKKYIFENKDVSPFSSNIITIFNDRIGIGTDVPDSNYKCTIQGNTLIRGTLSSEYINYPSSNLGNLILDNSGSFPSIEIIQRNSNQPYILFKTDDTNIVSIIDHYGNIGIGTSIAYERLIVNGNLVASNIEILNNFNSITKLQINPIHSLFKVTQPSRSSFSITTPGNYTVSPGKVHLYWNGYKLAYYNSNINDYTSTYSYDNNANTTTFTINMVRGANYGDIVDITVWPEIVDIGTNQSGKLLQNLDKAFWKKNKETIFINNNIGINTDIASYNLHVNGTTFTSNLIVDSLVTDDLNIHFLDVNYILTSNIYADKLGIGTDVFDDNVHLQVKGDLKIDGTPNSSLTLVSSNESKILFNKENTIIAQILFNSNVYINSDLIQLNNITVKTSNVGINNTNPLSSLAINGGLTIGTGYSNITAVDSLLIEGNLGIGTTFANYRLDVNGSINITGHIYNGSNSYYTSSQWINNNQDIYYIGNVGIGTTAPRARLDIVGTSFVTGNIGVGTTITTSSLTVQGDAFISGNLRSLTFVGMVSYFGASSVPVGWLECNGQSVSRTLFSDLFNYIGTTYGSGNGSTTFNLPDLRSEFIRGWDNGRGVDSGRAFGSSQTHAIENHTHQFNYTAIGGGGTSNIQTVLSIEPGSTNDAVGSVLNANTAIETRPRNIALLPCIKY